MCVLGDGGGDGDRGCITFDTQAILLDSECISTITLPECLPAMQKAVETMLLHVLPLQKATPSCCRKLLP